MRVVFIASECEPWAKTGGLGDVVDALARALGRLDSSALEGLDPPALDRPIDVYLPRYQSLALPSDVDIERLTLTLPDTRAAGASVDVALLSFETRGYRLRLVDLPEAFARPGIYGDRRGDFPDNAWRFGLLSAVALATIEAEGEPVDLIHLHDWHACPAALRREAFAAGAAADAGAGAVASGAGTVAGAGEIVHGAAVLLTLHNLAYHGWVRTDRIGQLGLPASVAARFTSADGLDLLAAGVRTAEVVNTVSPGYARQARTPAFGMGLEGLLRDLGDRFGGILNGLDPDLWDPSRDAAIAAPFSDDDLAGKAACRAAVLRELGLEARDDEPLLGVVGRFDPQKGIDLVADAAERLLGLGARLVVLGSGDSRIAQPFRKLAAAHPRAVAIREAFDRDLSRRIYAGSDFFLMPSRFEPCGQSQMIALRYGTPPIVHRTGGLADTVVDVDEEPGSGTGWVFDEPTADALVDAAARAIAVFRSADRGPLDAIRRRGMAVDFAWESGPARAYVAAYERAIELRRGRVVAEASRL